MDPPLYCTTNKRVIGKIKNECTGTPIPELVRLHPKMYSILKSDVLEEHRRKDVEKYVLKKRMHYEQ